ncbi:hypothetical protein LCY76_18185 [Fictibacillus sp. KIGAM418]|uniref:DUF4083 domain-containing protein n=1 Tax=Fictibacillus marinisediminis TaxID=2878389 RepID=A0A9X2BEC1_9BACL|nr:hypothetical protein [Fictibacillus marinisediminis]MCK6258506.1 hypothetical protein [Fictibacillus marinisediminis]
MSDLYLFFMIAMIGGLVMPIGTIILITKKITAPNDDLNKKIHHLEKEVEDLKRRL